MTRAPFFSCRGQTLYLGDAYEVLKELPDESVQVILTAPPYHASQSLGRGTWIGGDPSCDHKQPSRSNCTKCGATCAENDASRYSEVEDYVANLVTILAEGRRVLKNDGVMWLQSGDFYSDGTGLPVKNLYGTPWRLALALQRDGWILRSDIIWEHSNLVTRASNDRPSRSHDYLFLFSKQERYQFNARAIREDMLHPRTIWRIPSESKPEGYDYSTLPQHLVAKCLQASTLVDDTILDLFAGSATVGVVAVQLNRNSINVELNPEYIEAAKRRLERTIQALDKKSDA